MQKVLQRLRNTFCILKRLYRCFTELKAQNGGFFPSFGGFLFPHYTHICSKCYFKYPNDYEELY